MFPKDNMVERREHDQFKMEQQLDSGRDLQSEMYTSNSIVDFSEDSMDKLNPLYLRATINPGAHLTLDAEISALMALALVDLGVTRVFMHFKFVKQLWALYSHPCNKVYTTRFL